MCVSVHVWESAREKTTCVRVYVERVRPRFSKNVAFRNFVPVKESFVGSEYASVYESARSAVMLVYVTGSGRPATTAGIVFTFDKNEKKTVN